MTEEKVLSQDDLDHFEAHGYIIFGARLIQMTAGRWRTLSDVGWNGMVSCGTTPAPGIGIRQAG